MAMSNELYSQNESVKVMVKEYLEIKQQLVSKGISKTEFREQYEQQIADRILDDLQRCTNHKGFMSSIQEIMGLFEFSNFLERFCSAPKFYLILERYVSWNFDVFRKIDAMIWSVSDLVT